VNLVRNRLQLLLEREARADIAVRGRVRTQDCAHLNSLPAVLLTMLSMLP
jgi:hypothetical protein